MDQFDKAQIRAAKNQDKRIRYQPLAADSISRISEEPDTSEITGTLSLPKVKPPKTPPKRTNEIAMTIYSDGEEINLTVFVNLNDIIASQRNRVGFSTLLREAMSPKFGKVEIK